MALAVPVDDITAVSYRFAVKWSIPVEELQYQLLAPGEELPPHIIKSHIYRFKDVNNLEFSLHLTCRQNENRRPNKQNDYEMAVNCRVGLPIYLEDALILVDDIIYHVECKLRNNTCKGLIFNSMVLAQDKFRSENATFHCIMSIPVKVKATTSNPTRDPSVQNIVDCEGMLCDPGVHRDGYNDVSEFLFGCRIPDFNVDMAVRMMREAHLREIPLLKALCIEYLMENLAAENVVAVLKQSVESDAKDLSRICAFFLAERCNVVAHGKID